MRLYCLQMQRQDVHTSFEHFKQIYNTEQNNNNHVFGFNANIHGIYSQTYK